MSSLRSGATGPARHMIDLTEDSDGESVHEIQFVSSTEPAIKQEPIEERGEIIIADATVDDTETTRVEPGVEQIDSASVEADPEPACTTSVEFNDNGAESDVNQTSIEHPESTSGQLEHEEMDTGPVKVKDDPPDNTHVQVMDDQTIGTPAHLQDEPSDTVSTTEVAEIVPAQSVRRQMSVGSNGSGEGEPSVATNAQLDDVRIEYTNELQDHTLFVPETDEPDNAILAQPGSKLQDDTLFVPEADEVHNVIQTQPESEHAEVNLVDLLHDASTEHLEEQNEGLPLGEQDPFNTNNVDDSNDFEPLPDFDPAPDMDMDLDGIDALQKYNENKADLDEDDVLDDLPYGAGALAEDFAGNGYRTTEASPEPLGTVIDDNGDVMDWTSLMEEDAAAGNELAATAFAKRKQEYETKKEHDINTQEDDIRFAGEENEEQRRIRDLERSQMEVEEPPQRPALPPGCEDDELLFVPERPAMPESRTKKRAAPKPKNRLSKQDIGDAISAGIQAGFGAGRPPKRKALAPSEDRPPKKGRGANKGGGIKKPAPKRGRKKGPNMSNIASLGQTNIVAAAQANADRPDMPTFTATNKAKALQQLIASIPSSEGSNAGTADRTAILEATKKFKGRGAMRADGHGGWLLKGMESSLYNHQLLGAAFLRERETGVSMPKGGMVCDEMGFGKTIQMIANMIDGKAEAGSPIKTTLIIAPPSLLNQWMQEMDKHVKGSALGRILRYHAGSRLLTNNILSDLMEYDVILTSYGEVQRSYPLCQPPKHLVSEERKNEWWKNYYNDKVGPLHRIKFHRIVLDEAHFIKNYTSKTSIAVRALSANFKWCITGTPILNYLEELFPYFSFLKVPHTGDYPTFMHNYCNNRPNSREPVQMGRVHNILRAIMLRRTHVDTLFGAPIVKLPGITHHTVLVEFNPVERNIYNLVKNRYIQQINNYSKSGALVANVHNVLGMLLRLRMLCSHIMLIQKVLKRMFNASDIEALWRLTAKEVQASDDLFQLNMIRSLRKMIANKENTLVTNQTRVAEPTPAMTPDVQDDADMDTGGTYGLYFKFRKFLRMLSESETWTELHLRSTCAKCRFPPDEPVCTSCYHVYCKECIRQLRRECEERGNETACLECQTTFEETTPCGGLADLGFGSAEMIPKVAKRREKIAKRQDKAKRAAIGRRGSTARRSSIPSGSDEEDEEEEDHDWIENGGAMLPSAKLAATKAAILNWREKHPTQKIIVYTQFLDLGRIFSKICTAEDWGHIMFNGNMKLDHRAKAIERFAADPETFIMICSLKAGGVGLNLTMASKVIILDLWFNSAVEAQAYCRAFRIGQEQVVDVLRFVVKDSIDEDLIKMQERKDLEVSGAIGSDSMGKRATIQQLLQLFGEVREEGQNEFILVEDDGENDVDDDIDPASRLPPRPF